MARQRPNGFSLIEGMMPIGSERPLWTSVQCIAFLAAGRTRKPSSMITTDTNVVTASKGCSAGSKTGDVSQPVMTAAQKFLVSNRSRHNRHILIMGPEPKQLSQDNKFTKYTANFQISQTPD